MRVLGSSVASPAHKWFNTFQHSGRPVVAYPVVKAGDDDEDRFSSQASAGQITMVNDKKALDEQPFLLDLGTEINAHTAQTVLTHLLTYERWYKKQDGSFDPARLANKPVQIISNCIGGNLAGMFAILDQMDHMKAQGIRIETYVTGKALSGGAVIASNGTKGYRSISPRAGIMIHQASLHGSEKASVHDAQSLADNAQEQNMQMMDTLLANTYGKVTKDKLLNDTRHDLYLAPKEAIAYGVVDHIGVLSLPSFPEEDTTASSDK